MKKLIIGLIVLFAISIVPLGAMAQEMTKEPPIPEDATIAVFVRDDCAHCKAEKAFLKDFSETYPEVGITYYNLQDPDNTLLFNKIAETYGLVKGTPITLVRTTLISGFDTADTTGETISKIIREDTTPGKTFEQVLDGSATVFSGLTTNSVCTETSCEVPDISYQVTIPLIGKKIDVGTFSLTSMSLILGLIDGFNPCAMWVLVMFLLILSQLKSRKRMFQFAGLFILAEAVMYYLILNVWLTTWDFISLNAYVTPLVGLLALGSGIYFVYKFYHFKPVCSVTSLEQQQKISAKVKSLATKPMTFGVALGILALAFSVNIFEFACSIGIPQTYTKILELNNLGFIQTQWYMLLYIIMYMLDDMIVFGIALWSIEKIGVTHKYSKWTTLIGGILMLILGLIMLIRPELLVF